MDLAYVTVYHIITLIMDVLAYTLALEHKSTSKPLIIAKRVSPVCPKCSTSEKSGKRSCCARGGAWFQKCGAAGSGAAHTFLEGLEACEETSRSPQRLPLQRRSTAKPFIAKRVSLVCPKCATLKRSGKRSCCAIGGAWYRNCGRKKRSGSATAHTWAEGMAACSTLPTTPPTTAAPITTVAITQTTPKGPCQEWCAQKGESKGWDKLCSWQDCQGCSQCHGESLVPSCIHA